MFDLDGNPPMPFAPQRQILRHPKKKHEAHLVKYQNTSVMQTSENPAVVFLAFVVACRIDDNPSFAGSS
jgi:hypothetical protein